MSSNQRNRYNTTESQAPDCQDWTKVTMSKTRPQKDAAAAAGPPRTAASIAASMNSASAVVAATTSASKGNDDDAKKTKYIAKATSDAVRTSRCEKKLTQKELAQKCNMDVSIIAEIERGGCVYNATNVNKIQSMLGVKIPRA